MFTKVIIIICAVLIFLIIARRVIQFYFPNFLAFKIKTPNIRFGNNFSALNKRNINRQSNVTSQTIRQEESQEEIRLTILQEADLYFQKGDYDKAEKLYIKAAAKDPRNGKIYNKLGAIYIEQKNFADAKEAFGEALKYEKKASRYYNYGMACMECKDYPGAFSALSRAVNMEESNKKYQEALNIAKNRLT